MSIAKWYYDNNQVTQAVITLREAFVTFIGEIGGFEISDYTGRDKIAKEILNKFKLLRDNQLDNLSSLWKKIRDVRNAVGHPVFINDRDEDIRDKKRIATWIDSSRMLFEELKTSNNFRNLLSEIKNTNILKEREVYSVDDLKKKYNH